MKFLDYDGLKRVYAKILARLDLKVDKESGKQLSTNDYTTEEKDKLTGIEARANNYIHPTNSGNKHIPAGGASGKILKWKTDGTATWENEYSYTHPSTHAATMITQDATHRLVTDAEKTTWNGKAGTAVATQSTNGLESAADKKKLDGIETGANKYTHPSAHPATMITQDATHRMVTDTEKSTWNSKVNASGGDISNTKITTMDNVTTEFPVPAANDTMKGFAGKVKKFMTDFNSFKTGIITVGKLVNNFQTTSTGYALDARAGKTLNDAISQLNADLGGWKTYSSIADLGLTTSATMAQIQAKMADKSTLVVDAAEFKNFELSDKPWIVTFYKLNAWRCYAIGLDTYSGVTNANTALKYAVYNYSEWLGWFSLAKNADLSVSINGLSLIDTILPKLSTNGRTCTGRFQNPTDFTPLLPGYSYGFIAQRIHYDVIRLQCYPTYTDDVEIYEYEISKSQWNFKGSLISNSDLNTEKVKYLTKRLDNFSKTITYGYAEIGSPQSLGLPSGATLFNVMLDGWQSLNTGSISFGGNNNMIYIFSGASTVTANYITLRLVYK